MTSAAAAALHPQARRDRILLCAAGFLRSFAVGISGVLLGIYLNMIGWELRKLGWVVSIGLAGSALATLLVSLGADRFGRRRTLIFLGLLTSWGAVALVWLAESSLLYIAAFTGMINGLGRDRGPAYALEQAMLPQTATAEGRTFALAWYSVGLDVALALGSLAGGLSAWLHSYLNWDTRASYQAEWWVCALALLGAGVAAAKLSAHVEAPASSGAQPAVTPPTRRRVLGLAALTGMDSLGGGFLSGALLSYWFFRRFEMSVGWLAALFFFARMANAASHLTAAWLARRFGLLNTMVFTHIPSSLFLIAVPFAPSAAWAVALFLAREALVEMDVPTRQSYILAVVPPEARSYASGITTFTRNTAYAAAPGLAALGMSAVTLSLPLFLGGGIKIAYDVLLFFSFRKVKPPEEK